jgi:hypothetical protein
MVRSVARLAAAAIFGGVACLPAQAAELDLARWAAGLPLRFAVAGVKTEPTYQERVDITRDGDLFTLVGGAPAWAERSRESIVVARDGALRHAVCPAGMDCAAAPAPTGFLASALLVSALRRKLPLGVAATTAFGTRRVVCIPAQRIGVARPILDPCFDVATGAALAQRHRLTGRFDGPSLEPTSLRVAYGPT